MSKALKRLGITVLLVGAILLISMFFVKFPTATQVPHEVQVPYNVTETQTQSLDHRENYQIQTGHYAYSKFDLQAGKVLVATWQVDNTVSVYITNPSQFSSASLLGFPTSSFARKLTVKSGTLSYQIPTAGTYYVIITPFMSDVNVASYKSELQWQEEVTKYRSETQYQTETIYTSSILGINAGIGLLVLGSITTGLSFLNLKPNNLNPKKLSSVTCAYCGSIFSKKMDKCPNCGARKRLQ